MTTQSEHALIILDVMEKMNQDTRRDDVSELNHALASCHQQALTRPQEAMLQHVLNALKRFHNGQPGSHHHSRRPLTGERL